MKTAVVVFPGSNCDRDCAVALELFTKFPELTEGELSRLAARWRGSGRRPVQEQVQLRPVGERSVG